jgi:hypothetical protein
LEKLIMCILRTFILSVVVFITANAIAHDYPALGLPFPAPANGIADASFYDAVQRAGARRGWRVISPLSTVIEKNLVLLELVKRGGATARYGRTTVYVVEVTRHPKRVVFSFKPSAAEDLPMSYLINLREELALELSVDFEEGS